MKKYELDLQIGSDGRKQYIPQTQKRNFKYALEWCLENNWNSCKVNRTCYNFDFDKLEVSIVGVGYGNYGVYKIKEVF